jgi:hypothetical protein
MVNVGPRIRELAFLTVIKNDSMSPGGYGIFVRLLLSSSFKC